MSFIRVLLPSSIHSVYVAATRLVRRDRGSAAPTPTLLIRHELSHRDPKLIADEYLAWLDARKKARPRVGGDCVKSRVCLPRLAGRMVRRGSALPPEPGQN